MNERGGGGTPSTLVKFIFSLQKLENTSLLHSPPPVELFKLFIADDFVTKMAEQANFHAVQRGARRSFKPVSDGVINLYLYNFGSIYGGA